MREKKWVRRTLRQLSKGLEELGASTRKKHNRTFTQKTELCLATKWKRKIKQITSRPRPLVPIH